VNLLLDTHVFLWWDQQHPSLNASAGAAIRHPRNNVFVSAASVWEIAIKRRLGKLIFRGSVTSAIDANGFHELSMIPADAELAGELNWDHADPFDRILAAQSVRLGWALVTADRSIRGFGEAPQIWAG
jgi:PIN domain nuclease of toxin-antitoxin system